ncbi:regulatory protein RecX [Candidatus Neptunochlamydia vexilliferae]|nr:regulatory protein RecX [Candidatus Neptunochlamydia vexilliferae]
MEIKVVDNKRFSEITLGDEVVKEVHRRLYKNHLREILRASSKKELSDLLLKIDIKLARGLVYKWLSLKGYMRSELTKKLKTYKIDSEAIKAILDECEERGYINDKKEGRLFIERQKKRGFGPQMIAFKLSQKSPDLKEMVQVSDDEQSVAIQNWIEKKTRSADLHDIKVKQRLYRFLRGKGFDDPLIRKHLFVD